MTYQVKSRDGTLIGCERYGSGPPLVLVHGTSGDRTRWAAIGTTLEQRFTVYACDRRGRGLSGDGADYSIEREADDVAAIAEAIGEPIDLLGHSYGAIVALEAARRASVKRLVLYEPPITVGAPPVDRRLIEELDALLAGGDREGVVTTFLREGPRMPPDQLARMRELPSWTPRVAAAHTIPRELRASLEYRFAQANAPAMRTLLMLGGASPGFFREAIETLSRTLPNATVVTMAGQQHVAMDTAPSLFLAELLAFLD